MNLDHYKAASEHTDEAERLLIPPFKRTITIEDWIASIDRQTQAEEDEEIAASRWVGAEAEAYNQEEVEARREAFNEID